MADSDFGSEGWEFEPLRVHLADFKRIMLKFLRLKSLFFPPLVTLKSHYFCELPRPVLLGG
jgi:hypothetical protein